MRANQVGCAAEPSRADGVPGEVAAAIRRLDRVYDACHGWEAMWCSSWRVDGASRLQRVEEGSPWALHPDFGPVAVDIEFGWWRDGQRFRLDDEDRCVDGVHTRRQAIFRRVTVPPPEPRPDEPDEGRIRRLRDLLNEIGERDPAREVCVSFALLDASRFQVPRPTPVQCDANHWEGPRAARRAAMRGEAQVLRRRLKSARASSFSEAAQSVGVRVSSVTLAGRPRVKVVGNCAGLAKLLLHPEVESASLDREEGARAWGDEPALSYQCGGIPTRYRPPLDQDGCGGDPPMTFLDTLNAATGVYPYLAAGYNGTNVQGMATWAYFYDVLTEEKVLPDGTRLVGSAGMTHHLTLGVVDGSQGLDPNHPAFTLDPYLGGANRVRAWLGADGWKRDADVLDVPDRSGGSHGTKVAGIAMGNVMDGQDDAIVSESGADARSGVARRCAAYFAESLVSTALEHVDEADSTDMLDGLDVLSCSRNLNHSIDYVDAADPDPCPTDDDARGLDAESEAVVWAYLEKHLVTVKSAGNMYGDTWDCDAWGGVDFEVGAPGASPAALAVGALSSWGRAAERIQRTTTLWADSSGGRTGDGRSYPSLVVPAWQCGTAAARPGSGKKPYGDMGATSGATPRAAGSLLLFKHWYLAAHGKGYANQPGRLMAHMLNFGDGFASNREGTGPRKLVPSPGWGVGRFRLRLFDADGMSGDWFRSATGFTLGTNEYEKFHLAGGSAHAIPKSVQRLRVTVWWLEVNTGEGEERAHVAAWIAEDGGDVVGGTWRETSAENCLRWDYDCADPGLGDPPSGALHLTVQALSAPEELRYYKRSFRAFHVAVFWETGDDPSRIACPGASPPRRC